METFSKNKKFKSDTLVRLYNATKFKYCGDIKLGALVEVEQQHLDGSTKPAAWIIEDIKFVAFGDENIAYFFDKEKLKKISQSRNVKYYEKTKTKGFHLTQQELKEYCSFSF